MDDIDVEFDDNFFDCPFGDASNPACTAFTGNFIMNQLGIPRDYVTTGCLALVGFVAFYIVTTVLFLQFLPVQISFSKQINTSEREEGTAEAVARAKSAEQRPAEVVQDGIGDRELTAQPSGHLAGNVLDRQDDCQEEDGPDQAADPDR